MFQVRIICDDPMCNKHVKETDRWPVMATDQLRHKAARLGWRAEGGSWFCPHHTNGPP